MGVGTKGPYWGGHDSFAIWEGGEPICVVFLIPCLAG